MSRQVLFNGAVLVRPGAATKIDASGFANITLGGVGIVGIVGEADGGPPNVIRTFRNPSNVKATYLSGPIVEAAAIAFQPGNDARIQGGATLLVVVKVNQSTQATLGLNGSGGIGNVAGVAVTNQGTAGAVSYTYAVIGLLNGGFTAATGAAVADTTTGNAILNATNFNRITWTALSGAQAYWIYRTTVGVGGSPTSTGFIGFVAAGITTFDDTGLHADNTLPPSINTTGVSVFLTAQQWGVSGNQINAQVVAGATSQGRIITIKKIDSSGTQTETSPSLGDIAKFTLLYTGAGSAATATITQGVGGTLSTNITGAASDNVSFVLANFNSLADLITALNATGKYTATALISNAGQFSPTMLDPVTALSIKTTAGSLYASKFDLVSWINTNSQLVSAASGGAGGPPNTMGGPSYLSGGYRGVTNNTNFINGLAMLGSLRVNQVAALASTDGSFSETQPSGLVTDSYTALAVAAAVQAHCDFYSSTQGKNEREGWIGLHLSEDQAIQEANLLNDFNVILVIQQINLPTAAANFTPGLPAGTFIDMPEWATAVALAGMRAGAPLAEPLTWKYLRAFGVTNTSDWTVQDDADSLLLNGITVIEQVSGKGIRCMRCITTYTREDNDAYTEESVVQAWKDIAFTWRTAIEDRYTGTRGLLSNIQTVVPFSKVILSQLREQGEIADSFINGAVTPGFRDIEAELNGDVLSISGTVSPTEGINFELMTIFIVPAQIQV